MNDQTQSLKLMCPNYWTLYSKIHSFMELEETLDSNSKMEVIADKTWRPPTNNNRPKKDSFYSIATQPWDYKDTHRATMMSIRINVINNKIIDLKLSLEGLNYISATDNLIPIVGLLCVCC